MNSEHGTVYTKSWVVDMMLGISGYVADSDLTLIRVLEPSCGDGAFLLPLVHTLCESADKFNHAPSELMNSILAYDIDGEKISECKNTVSDVLRKHNWSEDDIEITVSKWIVQGDFLLSETQGSFDLVVGNPPYIRSSNLNSDLRQRYFENLETMTMGTDIFVGFIEKGLKSLKSDGKLCYICADRWMHNSYGKKLRRFVLDNHSIDFICRMHGVDAFENDVDAYPSVVLINNSDADTVFVDCSVEFNGNDAYNLADYYTSNVFRDESNFRMCKVTGFDSAGGPWSLADPETMKFINYAKENYPSLEETGVKVGIGVATGRDDVFVVDNPDLVESNRQIPLICNKDIVGKKLPISPKHWLVNPWDETGSLVDLKDYPLMSDYLNDNFGSLNSRHVAKKNATQWYRTIDKIKSDLITKPKLLFSDLSMRSEPMLDSGNYYPHHNLYWLTSDKWELNSLGGLLMSDQVESVIGAQGVKMRGKTMRFQAQYLRLIHLPDPSDISNKHLAGLKNAFIQRDRDKATEIAGYVFDGC